MRRCTCACDIYEKAVPVKSLLSYPLALAHEYHDRVAAAECGGSVSCGPRGDPLLSLIYALQNAEKILANSAARQERLRAMGLWPPKAPLDEVPPE